MSNVSGGENTTGDHRRRLSNRDSFLQTLRLAIASPVSRAWEAYWDW